VINDEHVCSFVCVCRQTVRLDSEGSTSDHIHMHIMKLFLLCSAFLSLRI